MRVLIVEDNLDIQANIADYLEASCTLDFAYSGPQGLELALNSEFDVIVLDIMLPGIDGIEVCRRYKAEARLQAPVLMLTARDTIDDKDKGFSAGADDYLVKPFSLRELKMRIEALARRSKIRVRKNLSHGDLQLLPDNQTILLGDKSVSVTEKEAIILRLLIEACPETVSGDTISHKLWGDEPPESGALRTHIYNLRRNLTALGAGERLKTVRARGYRLPELGHS